MDLKFFLLIFDFFDEKTWYSGLNIEFMLQIFR